AACALCPRRAAGQPLQSGIRTGAGGGAHATREVRYHRRGRATPGVLPLTRRTHPRGTRALAGARRQFARPRRTDEPPRPRGNRAARASARRLRRNGAARNARPAPARTLCDDSYHRAVTLALFDVDGTLLLTHDPTANRALIDVVDPSLADDAVDHIDAKGHTALWIATQLLGRAPDEGWCARYEKRYAELRGDTSHLRSP